MNECEILEQLNGLDLVDQLNVLEEQEVLLIKKAQEGIVELGTCMALIKHYQSSIRKLLEKQIESDKINKLVS